MDFFTGIVIAGLIGRSIWEAFKVSPEEKCERERIWREQIAAKEEKEKKAEAERRERERPFETSLECFQKQYVSYSRMATYNSCPHRFKLIYLDKKQGDKFDYMYRDGAAFHVVMMAYFNNHVGSVIHSLDYNEVIEGRRWYFNEVLGEKRKKRRNRVKFTCSTFPKDVEIIAVEKELLFEVNNIKFYGIVDLVLKYPDGTLEIVDYKTGLKNPVKEQLEIYSIPFTQYQDFSKVQFRAICPDRQSHYKWSLNRNEIDERRKHILDIVNTIINDSNFAPAISSACSRCSVRYECEHSEIYRETKCVSGKNNKLTRLTSNYEWKMEVTPHKIVGRKSMSNENKTISPNQVWSVGEYHFVNYRGKTFWIETFKKLYPEQAKQLMAVAKKQEIER